MAMLVICMQLTWQDNLTEVEINDLAKIKNQYRMLSLLVFPVASWSTRLQEPIDCVWYIKCKAHLLFLSPVRRTVPPRSQTVLFSHSNANRSFVLFCGVWPVCTGAWVWWLQSPKSTIAVLSADSSKHGFLEWALLSWDTLLLAQVSGFPSLDSGSCSRCVDTLRSLHQAWISRPGQKHYHFRSLWKTMKTVLFWINWPAKAS